MSELIPLYSYDGELCAWIGAKRLDRLVGADVVRVIKSRTGKVRRAVFHRRPGEPSPLSVTAYMGTRYSFRERLDGGHFVWSLKELGEEDELRPIFLRVLTDCLVRA